MPLSLFSAGDGGEIINIRGRPEEKNFLKTLGFVQGSRVKILSNNKGNMIVIVKEVRVAIGKDLSSKVFLRPL